MKGAEVWEWDEIKLEGMKRGLSSDMCYVRAWVGKPRQTLYTTL